MNKYSVCQSVFLFFRGGFCFISTSWTPTPVVFDSVGNYFDTDKRDFDSYLGSNTNPDLT